MEKVLYEKQINEGTPNAPVTIAPGTGQTDIAQQAPKIQLSRNIIGASLPALISYTQALNAPVGFIFGVKHREDTSVVSTLDDHADDVLVMRKLVETDVREVVIDVTNEVNDDIDSLFGNDFPDVLDDFLNRGGEVYADGEGDTKAEFSDFFLSIAQNRILKKINKDFTDWLATEASIKGTVNIPTYDDVARVFGAIGELREALYKQTHKSSKPWVLVTPRIAGFLSSTVGSTMNNGATAYNIGQTDPNNTINPFVMTMGDIDVYQYDSDGTVTGGSTGTTETTGRIYMGYYGGPNTSSLYYNPYKEYFIKGGDDYQTGQSSVFYRVRDSWSTNPLDTYTKLPDNVIIENSTVNPVGTNSSQYLVACDINFGENLIS